MLSDWGHVGFLLLLALIFPLGGIASSWMLGLLKVRPQAPNPIKEDIFECGVETEGTAWVQFNFRYYYYALLFVIFDVETVFLFPWAVKYGVMSRQFGFAALGAVLVFLIVVTFAYAYAWRKHALDWVYNE